MKRKFYVVWTGRQPGVYDNWPDAEEQVREFPGARFKAYPDPASAAEAFRSGPDTVRPLKSLAAAPVQMVNRDAFPDIDTGAVCVDAACSGNPGAVEYRAVELATGRQMFHAGPFPAGTNNIGEYLAIVHALAIMTGTGDTRTIYSDSKTALSWIRRRSANTRIPVTAANARIRALVARADAWLRTHTWPNKILKWNTEEWGEIPADFGRKH